MADDASWVTLEVADGTAMRAFVARPAAAARGGLILLQEAWGVDAHQRDVAARLAGEGWLTIAPELFHRSAPGYVGDPTNFPAAMEHIAKLTTDGLVADMRGAFDWLTTSGDVPEGRVGALGFCMGGRAAWLANSSLQLAAAVSYYGGGIAPGLLNRAPAVHGPHLFFWGGRDQRITPEQHRAIADALRAESKTFVDCEFSDAEHGFFNDATSRHHAAAARQSWALATAFLAEHLGGAPADRA